MQKIKINGVIPASSRVQGHIEFAGGLWVDGDIVGNLRAHGQADSMVVVNGSATVEGDIEADYVTVYGRVIGSVRAKESLEIGARAEISGGEISYKNIVVVEGAVVSGQMHLIGTDVKPAKAPQAPVDQRIKLVNKAAR